MRIVHTADTHLSFRAYGQSTPHGINAREADVARSFNNVIVKTIAIAPDLMVIGGDVFHQVRPGNRAIVHAYESFKRLITALPNTHVVMISGNHDVARTSEAGSILQLFRSLGPTMHVVDGPAQAIDFPQFDARVLCVPDNNHERPVLAPSGNRRFNVLLLHGETGGISGKWLGAKKEITAEELHVARWDYIALGHYHVYRELAPNMYYAGSIDYTSSDIWGERREEREQGISGKGVIERDLVTGAHTFHPLPRTREIVDLSIDALGLSPAEVSVAIRDVVESVPGGIDGAIVRVVAHDLEKHIARMLDIAMLREFRVRAMHFKLVERRPEPVLRASAAVHQLVRKRASIEELFRQMCQDAERTIASDVDREVLETMGLKYLAEAEDRTAAVVELTGETKTPALAGAA